ncbi:MAG: hypothetical protein BJBARM5_0361 [Candidatus Parvarchaeum acidophilus ARMAN-5]|jgi:hypothetical protein|uniref:Uncharacterized protein n=1 Tax=Candidatus Parvarchaeum acidophilus ARMAN-5 TaxID=662762 RepID=D6GV57_PARA5|nr:MAG: hypothetical protein BJBARM5_0361 [Candidatus Parvarchaeum acidophilus ARMAN-5]
MKGYPDRIMETNKSLDELLENVKRSKGKISDKGLISPSDLFDKITIYTKDPKAAIAVAAVVGRYNEKTATAIFNLFSHFAFYDRNPEVIIKAANIMSLDEIVNVVVGYKGDYSDCIVDSLSNIARYTRNREATIAAAEKIGQNKGIKSVYVAIMLLEIAYRTRHIGSKKAIMTTCHLLDKAGSRIFDMLDKDTIIKQYKELTELLDNSYEKNRKEYSLNLEKGEKLKIDVGKLPYYSLISVIGSRDPSNEKNAVSTVMEIAGEKAVNRARNEFNSHYKNLRNTIISYINDNDINGALKLLKDTKNEAINDIVNASEYRNGSRIVKGKNVLEAVESNNPLDYNSSVQIACVYLPANHKGGIVDYCKDERFKLIRYDVNGNTIGSAICYLEDGNFLVDSVEGHRTFRKKRIFDIVYKDLVNRAKEYHAKRIIFSVDGYNETPRKFIENIKEYGLKLDKTKMALDTEGYLEAKQNPYLTIYGVTSIDAARQLESNKGGVQGYMTKGYCIDFPHNKRK